MMATRVLAPRLVLVAPVALRNVHPPRRVVSSHGFSSTASSSSQQLVQYASDIIQKLIQDGRDDDDKANPHRPQTGWERIRNFPEGVKALLRDCFRYKAIHETPVNRWTMMDPTTRTIQPLNRIPRRQYEQQRQLRNDLRNMLPLVILWIPPIIGFLPPILAIVAPRQVMSRHFHNPFELDLFAQIEYQQRLKAYITLADMLWSSFERSNRDVRNAMARSVSGDGMDDEAGPLLDALTLYKTVFFHEDSPVVPRGMYLSIKDLPREYLVSIAFVASSTSTYSL
jgi:LETM1-like protein